MNKSVLILDTPVNCDECDLSCIAGYGPTRPLCSALRIFIDDPSKVCEDCPLKDLPKKQVCNEYDFENYNNGYNKGYNDAIDMITGEYNNYKGGKIK